jgi:hypothetical protein
MKRNRKIATRNSGEKEEKDLVKTEWGHETRNVNWGFRGMLTELAKREGKEHGEEEGKYDSS